MPKRRGKAKKEQRSANQELQNLPVLNLDAAAIDIGKDQHWVAVPPGRDTESVRSFGAFTIDLHAMAHWLKQCGIKSVVMESTGVYWIAPFQVLEQYGLEVLLIDARLAKNLPGRKSDVLDCQWHQQLHTFGLLRGCFLPVAEIVPMRSYLRLRDELVKASSQSIQHMQKALFEMNVQLANVISDITGETGLAIIEAILAGERDGKKLAQLKHRRIVASQETIAKSLEGNWRPELLFALQTALDRYKFYQQQIGQCDGQIAQALAQLPTRELKGQIEPEKKAQPSANKQKLTPLGIELKRVTGVDLTSIDGIGEQIAQIILSELGPDLQRSFKSEKHFSSYLGLCPGTKISGGKVLKRKSRKVKHRVATALRLAARSLHSSDSALGANFRRLKARLGAPKAITAMANKLAKLVYRLLVYGKDYFDRGAQIYDQKFRLQQIRRLQKQAKMLNLKLVPA
ncbi:MAG TPA: IS110 family transposase [Chthoniobacterales bacterium]|nr:IS110 family transposase [Chthoniobacterales bacterium]